MTDLTGQLLIAMPDIGDPRFDRSVVLLCEHSEDGAMGVILNKMMGDVTLDDLVAQLELGEVAKEAPQEIYFGGPVDMGRGFVLHTAEYVSGLSSHLILEGLRMSTSLDVLEDIAQGTGPQRVRMALGYAGWGAGQLEGEIAQNGWLTCAADADFVFETTGDAQWAAALRRLGVDPLLLSAEAGRA